ncbi:dTMP kinase [Candidatus Saccharibacteria bacterium]|nr:dTMP kinase [Candidatus Saccharibacteria bacterium]
MTQHQGNYIVIEGIDGTGKSTQVELLAKHYQSQGYVVTVVEEPSSNDLAQTTPIAHYLRTVIKNGNLRRDPEINLALLSTARRELWQQIIQPALERGETVLASRNYFSTLAYQGYGEGLSQEHIRHITGLFTSQRYLTARLSHHPHAQRRAGTHASYKAERCSRDARYLRITRQRLSAARP